MAVSDQNHSIKLNSPDGKLYSLSATTVNTGTFSSATYTTTTGVFPIYTMETSTPTATFTSTGDLWLQVDPYKNEWFYSIGEPLIEEEDVAYEDMMAKED